MAHCSGGDRLSDEARRRAAGGVGPARRARVLRAVVGLSELDADGDVARLGGDETAVELAAEPAAPPRSPSTTGLFHLAILVPDRAELARSLRRVVESGWPLAGASDHLVSEALYLADPEGNGIEIYRDRPREEWRFTGGELEMATLPLDLRSSSPRRRRERPSQPPSHRRRGSATSTSRCPTSPRT